jgi:hypothetical protein
MRRVSPDEPARHGNFILAERAFPGKTQYPGRAVALTAKFFPGQFSVVPRQSGGR